MKSSQEDIILLENYLKGHLSPADISKTEQRLSVETDLAEDLQSLRILMAATRASVLKDKMNMLKNLEADNAPRKGKTKWLWTGLIFFLLALGYLLYYIAIKDVHQVDAAYAHIFETEFDRQLILHETMRSAEQPGELTADQRRAYELYSLQLFEEAAPLLETLWQEKKDTLALFYLGVSQVGAGRTDEGLRTLRSAELQKYSHRITTLFNQ